MTSAENQPDATAPELAPAPESPAPAPAAAGDGQPAEHAAAIRRRGEAHGHHHRDVSGGWLRPAVFGAMDGLVTNVSLISGVGGGGVRGHAIVLTGLAGLAAGAFSMATGEYVSVSSQNELVEAEVTKERFELEHNPESEARELAAMFRHRGVDADLADRVARQVGRSPEEALRMHVREELGVDHNELPSPYVAAGASLVTFAVGALIPLLPFLFGFHYLWATLLIAGIAAFIGGGTVAGITNRPFLRGAIRQLVLAGAAAGLTYAIGTAVHTAIG
jgi:vacuolar iron transporter family protein